MEVREASRRIAYDLGQFDGLRADHNDLTNRYSGDISLQTVAPLARDYAKLAVKGCVTLADTFVDVARLVPAVIFNRLRGEQ